MAKPALASMPWRTQSVDPVGYGQLPFLRCEAPHRVAHVQHPTRTDELAPSEESHLLPEVGQLMERGADGDDVRRWPVMVVGEEPPWWSRRQPRPRRPVAAPCSRPLSSARVFSSRDAPQAGQVGADRVELWEVPPREGVVGHGLILAREVAGDWIDLAVRCERPSATAGPHRSMRQWTNPCSGPSGHDRARLSG